MAAEWGAMRAVGMAGAALRVKWPWGRKVSSPRAQPHSRPPGPLPRAPEAEERRPPLGLLLGHPGLGLLNSAASSTLPGPWGPTPRGQSLQASLEAHGHGQVSDGPKLRALWTGFWGKREGFPALLAAHLPTRGEGEGWAAPARHPRTPSHSREDCWYLKEPRLQAGVCQLARDSEQAGDSRGGLRSASVNTCVFSRSEGHV